MSPMHFHCHLAAIVFGRTGVGANIHPKPCTVSTVLAEHGDVHKSQLASKPYRETKLTTTYSISVAFMHGPIQRRRRKARGMVTMDCLMCWTDIKLKLGPR